MSFRDILDKLMIRSRLKNLDVDKLTTINNSLDLFMDDEDNIRTVKRLLLNTIDRASKDESIAKGYAKEVSRWRKRNSERGDYFAHMAFVRKTMHTTREITSLVELPHALPKQEQPEVPKLELNEEFPGASKKLKKVTVGGKDHVICTEPIAAGEYLFVESPLASVVKAEYSHMFCSQCCARINEHCYPCKNCPEVIFCSMECEASASPYHVHECGFLKFVQTGNAHLAFRLFLRRVPTTLIHRDNLKAKEMRQLQALHDAELPYNITDMPKHMLLQHTVVSVILLQFLKTNNFFPEKVNPWILKAVGRNILLALMQVHFNSAEVGYPCIRDDFALNWIFSDTTGIISAGSAVYSPSSKVQHACDPYPVRFWQSKNINIIMTVIPMEPGQEVLICDGPSHYDLPREQRQLILKERYFYKCNCHICRHPFDAHFLNVASKCPMCKGPSGVVHGDGDDFKTVCYMCNIAMSRTQLLDFRDASQQLQVANANMSLKELLILWRECRRTLHCQNKLFFQLVGIVGYKLQTCGRYGAALNIGLMLLSALKSSYGVKTITLAFFANTMSHLASAAAETFPEGSRQKDGYLKEADALDEQMRSYLKLVYGVSKLQREFVGKEDHMF